MGDPGAWIARIVVGVLLCWLIAGPGSTAADGVASAGDSLADADPAPGVAAPAVRSPLEPVDLGFLRPAAVDAAAADSPYVDPASSLARLELFERADVPLRDVPLRRVPSRVALAEPSPQEVIGFEALDSMRFDWAGAFPEWTVEFHRSRPGLRALTFPHEKRIEVFVRDDDSVSSIHRVLAHEFGHVVDVEWNTPQDRRRWADQRGLADSVVWWPDESAADFATGAGDFAEAFAVWEVEIRSRSTVAGQPDDDDLALLAELAS